MKYINRYLLVSEKEHERSYTDVQFCNLSDILIITGEPGAGKTSFAKAMSDVHGWRIENAEVLANEQPMYIVESSEMLIIDGLDEIRADTSTSTIQDILSNLKAANIYRFILTCRAADWAHASDSTFIERRFGKKPIIGRLKELDEDQIKEIIIKNHPELDSEEFLTDAEHHQAVELIRNPQMLELTLEVISQHGWPNTKTDLFENACTNYAKESNTIHDSLSKHLIHNEKIKHIAGNICAQLLLSGKRYIQLEGDIISSAVKINALSSEEVAPEEISQALASKLFAPSGPNLLGYTHRTVAEFLAAKWLVSVLSKSLSRRRLESLIYQSENHTPTSLRGLHAWMATLDRNLTNDYTKIDPYGCLRYGDVAQFSLEQIKILLNNLENYAKYDPYLRNEDWDTSLGNGLARSELKPEIVHLIKNPNIPEQLASIVLETLIRSNLSDEIIEDLLDVILDSSQSYYKRHTAIKVITHSTVYFDPKVLCLQLKDSGTASSIRLAIEVVEENLSKFTGKEITQYFYAHEKLSADYDTRISGIGYKIPRLMTNNQLEEAIEAGISVLSSDIANKINSKHRYEEKHIEFLQLYLANNQPSAEKLWSWIKVVDGNSFAQTQWEKFTKEYFDKNSELRQAIQLIILQPMAANKDCFLRSHYKMQKYNLSFWGNEGDVIYVLNHLFSSPDLSENLLNNWADIVSFTHNQSGFSDQAMSIARTQASTNPALQLILNDILNAPIPKWEIEEEQKKKKREQLIKIKTEQRHQNYSAVRENISAGKQLKALYKISQAYLGCISHPKKIEDAEERVKDLIGETNLQAALDGVLAACDNNDIPTPRESSVNHAENQKEFFMEAICMARCIMQIKAKKNLNEIEQPILLSALLHGYLGLRRNQDNLTTQYISILENIIFSDKDLKEQFVRDTLEPSLQCNLEHVSGLSQVMNEKRFNDIVGDLALDWLEKYPNLSTQTLYQLINAAIRFSNREKLLALTKVRLEDKSAHTEPQKKHWYSVTFVCAFSEFEEQLKEFAREKRDNFWSFKDSTRFSNNPPDTGIKTSPSQLGFIIAEFASIWSYVGTPKEMFGSTHPHEATMFIQKCITEIGSDISDEASSILSKLIKNKLLGDYKNHGLHIFAEQNKKRAELKFQHLTHSSIQKILLSSTPTSIDDLQSLVLDELELLQKRIQDGYSNTNQVYWNNKKPHKENYCRDRIIDGLEAALHKYQIRPHIEGTMPNNKRCDILCTYKDWDLPIEIKGQWHPNVWTAACDQLEENYSRSYRANGRGIYLVVWFGSVVGKNPPKSGYKTHPSSCEEMLTMINERAPRAISSKTKIFVLDVSKPQNQPSYINDEI